MCVLPAPWRRWPGRHPLGDLRLLPRTPVCVRLRRRAEWLGPHGEVNGQCRCRRRRLHSRRAARSQPRQAAARRRWRPALLHAWRRRGWLQPAAWHARGLWRRQQRGPCLPRRRRPAQLRRLHQAAQQGRVLRRCQPASCQLLLLPPSCQRLTAHRHVPGAVRQLALPCRGDGGLLLTAAAAAAADAAAAGTTAGGGLERRGARQRAACQRGLKHSHHVFRPLPKMFAQLSGSEPLPGLLALAIHHLRRRGGGAGQGGGVARRGGARGMRGLS